MDMSRAWPLLRSLQNVTTLTKPQRLNFRSRKNRKGQLRLGGKRHPGGVPPAPHLLRCHPVPPRLSLSAAQAPSPAPHPSSQTHGLRAGKSPKTAPRCRVGSEQSPGCPPGTCLHHAPLTTHPPAQSPASAPSKQGQGPAAPVQLLAEHRCQTGTAHEWQEKPPQRMLGVLPRLSPTASQSRRGGTSPAQRDTSCSPGDAEEAPSLLQQPP